MAAAAEPGPRTAAPAESPRRRGRTQLPADPHRGPGTGWDAGDEYIHMYLNPIHANPKYS